MPNPNIEGKESKDRKCPILGGGEISSAYFTNYLLFISLNFAGFSVNAK